MNRVLAFGADGTVGKQLKSGVIRVGKNEADITDASAVGRAIDRYRPDWALNLAAATDFAWCEEHPEAADRINAIGAENVAHACQSAGIGMIHLSTCAVFDGDSQTPYAPGAPADAHTAYGRSKARGESLVLSAYPEAIIIRTGWLFGGGPGMDARFVTAAAMELCSGGMVRAANDRIGSPTFVPDLIQEMETLMGERRAGISHVVNAGMATYADIAYEIIRRTASSGTVTECRANELGKTSIRRGRMEALLPYPRALRPWQEALADYLSDVRYQFNVRVSPSSKPTSGS